MMQEVEVLKIIKELVCSYFSEEQFTLSFYNDHIDRTVHPAYNYIHANCKFKY